MRIKIESRPRIKPTVSVTYTKLSFGLALLLTSVLLIWLSAGTADKVLASGGSPSENISEYDFETDLSSAKSGASFTSISSTSFVDGSNDGDGVNPGTDTDNDGINIVFDKSDFDIDGIDFQVDYKYLDQNASIIARGDCMEFDIVNRKLNVKYRVSTDGVGFTNTAANNIHTLSNGDTDWHTYRFVYDPNYAQGFVMFDGDTVWSQQEASGSKLYFTNCSNSNVVVGNGMTASGAGVAILDNLAMKNIPYQALPVEYEYVRAEPKDNGVQFEWKTFSELNLSGFDVERSVDGRFYETIETLPSLAMDGTGTDYAIFDPAPSDGLNYYRIKSVDMDGTQKWSDVVAVEVIAVAEQNAIRDFAIYPNPIKAGSPTNLKLDASSSGDANIRVYNIEGRQMVATTQSISVGLNQTAINDVTNLTPGIYIFKVEFNGEEKSSRLVIQ